MTECELMSRNITDVVPFLHFEFGSIPEHLISYGCIMMLSLLLYGLLRYFGYLSSKRETNKKIPSFWRLLFMKEDEWIMTECGIAALDYIQFQRLLLFPQGTILCIVSTVLLLLNISSGKPGLSHFESTTIIAITDDQILTCLVLTLSLIVPAMLIPCIFHHGQHINNDRTTPNDESRTCTVGVFGFDKNREMEKSDVSKFWEQRYSKLKLVDHCFVYNTSKLHRLLHQLRYVEETIAILEQSNEKKSDQGCINSIICGNKTIDFYKIKENEQKEMIKTEARNIMTKCNRLAIIFLTFESQMQARRVVEKENNCMRRLKNSGKEDTYTCYLAPHPDYILWANLRERKLSCLYFLIFCFIMLLVFSIFATPFAFITQVQQLVKPVLETLKMRFMASLMPTLLYFIFTNLMPQLIKLGTVKFGDWSYTQVVPSYMRRVYCWNLSSIVILPLLMLTNTTGITALIIRTLLELFGEELLPDPTWDCVFLPDSGAFFINYLIISCMGSQIQLYRLGDRIYEMWLMLTSCRSVAEKTAAKIIGEEYNMERTGLNMCLAEDYVTLLLNFSIAITFCVSCPLVTYFFLLYLIIKHMVDIQNFRLYYTAKFHKDLLLKNASKIAIFSTLLININIAASVLSVKVEDNYTLVASGCIAIYSICAVLICCNLFAKEEEKYGIGRGCYDRSYIDPCLTSIKHQQKILI